MLIAIYDSFTIRVFCQAISCYPADVTTFVQTDLYRSQRGHCRRRQHIQSEEWRARRAAGARAASRSASSARPCSRPGTRSARARRSHRARRRSPAGPGQGNSMHDYIIPKKKIKKKMSLLFVLMISIWLEILSKDLFGIYFSYIPNYVGLQMLSTYKIAELTIMMETTQHCCTKGFLLHTSS